ncbi:MAG TPA: carbohydrate kinase family protein, partial [Pseudomonadales bacterium]|nr:carbohydrate kinase family protein [Pseudomonadales bacterium]
VTIGSATVDNFADTEAEVIRIETPHSKEQLIAYPLGSKILIKHLDVTTGGGGTNTAVCCARLGLRTAFLGKIGEDPNGDFIIRSLAAEGVDFIGVREGKSGYSVILDSFIEDRTILAFKGANNDLRYDEIKPLDTDWIYISSMLGESWETVVKIAQHTTAKVVFNPSNYQAELGYEKLRGLIDRLEILVLNKEECCKLLGLDYKENYSPKILMQKMAELPPRIIVMTDGSAGAYVYDREFLYHGLPSDDLKVVETTGAGDAFASSFTAGKVMGFDTPTCIKIAMTNAESVLSVKGAKEALLSKNALLEKVQQDTRRIDVEPL